MTPACPSVHSIPSLKPFPNPAELSSPITACVSEFHRLVTNQDWEREARRSVSWTSQHWQTLPSVGTGLLGMGTGSAESALFAPSLRRG